MIVKLPHHFPPYFRDKRIVVTGGTGLIGRSVCEMLHSMGAKLTIITLDDLTSPYGTVIKGNLNDFKFCQHVTKGADQIFHLAGIKADPITTKLRPASFFVPMLMMNTNLLEAARLNDVSRVVYTSSIGAYPPAEIFHESHDLEKEFQQTSMDQYPGWAKRMAELQIEAYRKEHGLLNRFAVVRPCNVFGKGDSFDPINSMVIPSLIAKVRQYQRNGTLVELWGDGSPIRDFLYSEDCAFGILCAAFYGTYEWPYVNLGSGHGISILELVQTMQTVVPFEYVFDKTKPNGFPKRVMDISVAMSIWPYIPQVNLETALRETWDWYIKHEDEYKQRQQYFK
ncbi:NAD-dependent epimerase/dehydratase family protein [Candidatus Woesearchaeota archaeon]|nr:NAD-dependent epimerase/dehydratase family protein [Candidatus Woesearchaeota archaeon]